MSRGCGTMPRARTPRSGEGCRAQSNANRTRGKSAPGGAQTKNTVRTTVRSYLQGRGKRKEKRGISLATAPRMGVYKKGKHKPEGCLPEGDRIIPHYERELPTARRPEETQGKGNGRPKAARLWARRGTHKESVIIVLKRPANTAHTAHHTAHTHVHTCTHSHTQDRKSVV